MKRFLCVILALVMVTGVSAGLAGCAGDGRIEITVGMWPEPHLRQDNDMFNEWKRKFEQDYPEYKVTAQPYTYSPDTFFTMAQSGAAPTVFQTWFTEPQKLIKNRYVKDITAQLTELGWLDKMDDMMRAALSDGGKVYGVPRDGYGLGIMINIPLLAEVDVLRDVDGDGEIDLYDTDGTPLYPTTFEQIYEVSKLVTENTTAKGMVILSANNNGGWQFANMAWNYGAELQTYADGKWTAGLNSQGAIDALSWIRKMRSEELLPEGTTFSYNDWYTLLGSNRVAMCIAGSDAVALPVTNVEMKLKDIAFVPMPAGREGKRYSLFGGTPYMFSSSASDEEVMGALKFLEYMGRSPETSEISRKALEDGAVTANKKGMPILPAIKPWKDAAYLELAEGIEQKYVNVNMDYYKDFYDTVYEIRRKEEVNFCQEMYEILDAAIQSVLSNPNANPAALLATANSTFQTQYLNNVK